MPLRTDGGYDLFETLSALQKTIRRGLEADALFWALELAGRYDTALWNRLKCVASEDVGIADNTIAVLIHALYDHYRELAKGQGRSQYIVLSHAILALCRAPKSRIADDLAGLVRHQRESEGLRLEMPNFALDQHTRRGKALGRGIDHWDQVGCQLAGEVEGLNIYHEQALSKRQQYGRLKPKAKGRRSAMPEQLDLEDVGEA